MPRRAAERRRGLRSGAERDRRAGIEPAVRETYENGVRQATFHDPDGNVISCGGAALE
ncbi:hypothetical protein [Kribbella sp.]|uniref:hypothetical protein n=1 Tax=Kribbella sp. TaxID=1871183 RepID=UPI002D54F474|nr:hypothetical protein [Kribbella sp.]HZX06807.1 hypothetical protein [Kribbella sp.]